MINDREDTGFEDIPIGAEVYSSDGELLGVVRGVKPGWFAIASVAQPDFWLPASTAASTVVDKITLNITRQELGSYRVAAAPED